MNRTIMTMAVCLFATAFAYADEWTDEKIRALEKRAIEAVADLALVPPTAEVFELGRDRTDIYYWKCDRAAAFHGTDGVSDASRGWARSRLAPFR